MKLQQFLSNEENVTKSKDHLVAPNNKLNMVESLLNPVRYNLEIWNTNTI